jgi:hypothetical protein
VTVIVDWDGFPIRCDIDSFVDDVTYVRDVEVYAERVIYYIPRCICCGTENFGLGSLHDDCVGLAGATPQKLNI